MFVQKYLNIHKIYLFSVIYNLTHTKLTRWIARIKKWKTYCQFYTAGVKLKLMFYRISFCDIVRQPKSTPVSRRSRSMKEAFFGRILKTEIPSYRYKKIQKWVIWQNLKKKFKNVNFLFSPQDVSKVQKIPRNAEFRVISSYTVQDFSRCFGCWHCTKITWYSKKKKNFTYLEIKTSGLVDVFYLKRISLAASAPTING